MNQNWTCLGNVATCCTLCTQKAVVDVYWQQFILNFPQICVEKMYQVFEIVEICSYKKRIVEANFLKNLIIFSFDFKCTYAYLFCIEDITYNSSALRHRHAFNRQRLLLILANTRYTLLLHIKELYCHTCITTTININLCWIRYFFHVFWARFQRIVQSKLNISNCFQSNKLCNSLNLYFLTLSCSCFYIKNVAPIEWKIESVRVHC